MFAQMKGVETGQAVQKKSIEPASAGAAIQDPSDQPVANPIGSKFTFDNFVYGDENKLAYHSAMRFAAFADEPGQYNSLFIYGGSGLGKTHLLLAIKNHLAVNKPHIKVKYANSQAYIDDFINEIARQKTEGRAILREYHEANVLIIDDIQNIIGKQASIEYFFSLMDEFIRENKKVVIASDRAPKNLGMDERLTSRFNAGMLCLVSEPGFEMKYMILKRYYENTIKGGDDLSGMNVDPSLLGAFQTNDGTLTDEQLRHMAEISRQQHPRAGKLLRAMREPLHLSASSRKAASSPPRISRRLPTSTSIPRARSSASTPSKRWWLTSITCGRRTSRAPGAPRRSRSRAMWPSTCRTPCAK